MDRPLVLIPARGGSKGIPNKNIILLNERPLLYYTLDVASQLSESVDICVSTDDSLIKAMTEDYGIEVPFIRPPELSTDYASTHDVLLHALNYYLSQGIDYRCLIILQPTSPFRTSELLKNAINLFDYNLDMVVSVNKSHANPYFNLFEEETDGYLTKSKSGDFERRQDCPEVFQFNGSIYVINATSIQMQRMSRFKRVKKFLMEDYYSVDIDTPADLAYCEFLLKSGLVKL